MALAKPLAGIRHGTPLSSRSTDRDIHGTNSADLKFHWKYSCWVRQGMVGAAGMAARSKVWLLTGPPEPPAAQLALPNTHGFKDHPPAFSFLPHARSRAAPHGDGLAGDQWKKIPGGGMLPPETTISAPSPCCWPIPTPPGIQPADKKGFSKQMCAPSQWNSYGFDNEHLKGKT